MPDHIVAKTDNLKRGEMRELAIGDDSVLLLRIGDEYRAFAPYCQHFGAPLAKGLLIESHIRCPWHQSVFDAATGNRVQPPSLDGTARFPVRVEGQNVIVSLPDNVRYPARPDAAKRDPKDKRTFVILGTGGAGMVAAEELRYAGFPGRVVMVTREKDLPYDRTMLSKQYMGEEDKPDPSVRSPEFYKEHDIEIQTEREVVEAEMGTHHLKFSDGKEMPYDRLLLAPGSIPNTLDVPGKDLENVFLLRSFESARQIRNAGEKLKKVAIIGASFIGMEVAANLTELGAEVTVIAPSKTPFERVLGQKIGRALQKAHEEKGVKFRLERKLQSFDGSGKLGAVTLDNGEKIDAEMAVIGVGVRPATSFIKGSSIRKDGGIKVNSKFEVAADVYAAGDIAAFPDWRTGESIRIEHWRLAQQHGQFAARNMTGIESTYEDVPFFWTNQFDIKLRYVGYAGDWDRQEFDGDPSDDSFLCYFLSDNRVLAVAGAGFNMLLAAEALKNTTPPTLDEVRRKMG